MKDDKPADESSILNCLSIVTKDEVILEYIAQRENVVEELKGTMSNKQIGLFSEYQKITNMIRNRAKHNALAQVREEINKIEELI
jgi:hypothetical protein